MLTRSRISKEHRRKQVKYVLTVDVMMIMRRRLLLLGGERDELDVDNIYIDEAIRAKLTV